jgi:hypothetical protein
MGNRLLAAAPDALTSAIFVTAWIAPTLLGPEWVKNLMLTMLIEFIVMHSSAFFSVIAASGTSRSRQVGMLVALTAFYSLFIAAFSFAFRSTWPLFAFGWLFVSRFMHLLSQPGDRAKANASMMQSWGASAVFYILGVFVTVLIPLPMLGLTLYFAAQAWLKSQLVKAANASEPAAGGTAVA